MRLCGTQTHTHAHCATLADIIRNHSWGKIKEKGAKRGAKKVARSKEHGARRKGANNILWAGLCAVVGVNIVICCDIEVIVCPFDAVQIPSTTHTQCTSTHAGVLKGHLNVCLQLGRSTGRGRIPIAATWGPLPLPANWGAKCEMGNGKWEMPRQTFTQRKQLSICGI